MARVLVVEDEPRIASFVSRALSADGLAVDEAHDGVRALDMARTGAYELIVLDLLLPGMDGESVLKGVLESRPDQPVLVLSALSDVESRVRCLELGAADFLTKPFAIVELLARVHARLRAPGSEGARTVLRAGRLSLDLVRREADAGGGSVALSAREASVLAALVRRPGQVVSRQLLLSEVWGYSFDPGTNVADVYVGRLRSKLGPDLIETVRHAGYRLLPP
ncbi:MAG: response regulator transcription factor [Actinobacteria bacterium]|nr:response regulator transcription factor [Actinomycetota bacterium]